MFKSILKFSAEHFLVLLYLGILFLLSIGIVSYYGLGYEKFVLIHALSLVVFYVFFLRFIGKNRFSDKLHRLSINPNAPYANNLIFIIVAGIIVFVGLHLYYLGSVPVLEAYKAKTIIETALIRQHITDQSASIINYGSSILVKGLIPLVLLVTLVFNRKAFLIVYPVAAFYAFSLMQKSFIVSMHVPILVYSLIHRKWINSFFYVAFPTFVVFLLVYITNPDLRNKPDVVTAEQVNSNDAEVQSSSKPVVSDSSKVLDRPTVAIEDIEEPPSHMNLAGSALLDRVLFTPGKTAGLWFKLIPAKLPFSKGCGYRFLAGFLGCDFADYDYSWKLYEVTNPQQVAQGVHGTANTASFVNDYANFGVWGLILSSLLLSLIFVFIRIVYTTDISSMITLNTLFVLWLSSGVLSTILVSGGWLFVLIGYLLFKNFITGQKQIAVE